MSEKQGLHGVRAFLAVVGSGIMAGLLVVWLVSSSFKAFVSTASEGLGNSNVESSGSLPSRGPVSSLEPGSFDLCQSIENIQAFNSVYQERLDDGSEFVDTALSDSGGGVRKISNDCSWSITVGGLEESEMALSYMSRMGGDSVDFEEAFRSVENLVEEVSGEGGVEGLPGGGRYLYGRSGGEEVFAVAGLVKNTSFSLVFRNNWTPGDSFEVEYRTLVRQMIPDIRERLDRVVPD